MTIEGLPEGPELVRIGIGEEDANEYTISVCSTPKGMLHIMPVGPQWQEGTIVRALPGYEVINSRVFKIFTEEKTIQLTARNGWEQYQIEDFGRRLKADPE